MLDKSLIEEISRLFDKPDISLIKEVIYFDGWATYEEDGGVLIFIGIDGSYQKVEYGTYVFAEDNTNYFELEELTVSQAFLEIQAMKTEIEENNLAFWR